MTYTQRRFVGSTSASGSSGISAALTWPSLTPGSLALVAVGCGATAKTVASITVDSGSGTFTLVGAINSVGRRLELWIGRGFTDWSQSTTVNFDQSAGGFAVHGRLVDTSADLTIAPTLAANAGSTATSTTPDTGTLTPAVGDILIAGAVWATVTASSGHTSTGNTFLDEAETTDSSTLRVALAWCQASAAVASKLVWTIGSAEWAAMLGAVTLPADAAAGTGLLYKGRLTAAADQAANA